MSLTLTSAPAGQRPYIGLRYFEERDAGLFYGRDEHVAEILGKVARDRFVAILGSSGSGKSSLIRAGLLPELRSGMIPQAGPRWRVVEFKPGNAPLGELAEALHTSLGVTNAAKLVEEGPLGIVHAVTAAQLPDNTNVLVIADQFEEVFRFQREERDRGRETEAVEQCQALVRKLLDAAAQTEIPIYVLLAMRSDYLGECAQFHELPERISRSMYLVPRLRRDQVQEVITAPVGNQIEPALVQELLGKAGADPDQLPRLQHLLNRIWTLADGGFLTLDHYAQAGSWEGGLAKNLNEIYTSPGISETICARLFQQLSDVDESNRVVRRRAPLDELIQVCGPDVIPILAAFHNDGFIRSGNPVDITHECILRNWDRVKDWLRSEIEARDFYREIRARQKRQAILSGSDLATAQKYLASGHYSPAWAERYGTAAEFAAVREFVLSSSEAERKSSRRERRLRYALMELAAAVVLALGILVVVLRLDAIRSAARSAELLREKNRANDAADRAMLKEKEAREAQFAALQEKIEAERQKKLAQKGENEARRERLIAKAQTKRADEQAAALKEFIGKNEAARSGQQSNVSLPDAPAPTAVASEGPPASAFEARDLAQLYDFPTDLTGRGQTIAFIELGGGYNTSDLKTYFAQHNLPVPNVTSVSVDGAQNKPGSPADGQVTADIEVAGAVASAAQIVLFFAPNTNQGFIDAVNAATHDTRRPSVLSIGWGGPEQSWTPQAIQALNEALHTASSQGITVIVASGDNGASDGLPGLQAVDFPASSPWVLAVGGTRLTAAHGKIVSETVWNDGEGGGATGGGFSNVIDAPAWQTHITRPASKSPRRGIPDVSANAAPASGYRIFLGGRPSILGGTSLTAPFWAGLVALLNQGLGHNLGFLNPLLYEKLGPAGVFRSITEGDNSFGKVKGYSAGPGWNACTGWGSPDGRKLLAALKEHSQ